MCRPAPFEMTVLFERRETDETRSCVDAVAFFVFFAGAARAGIVASNFCAGADRFGGFGLRWPRLIL